jgi:Cof subfamily protein (haloacid dehalogenase superfamily)
MKKLISIDLDGTLLNHQSELSELSIKTIEYLKTQGHIVMLATGRPLSGALRYYQLLNLNTPLVTDNGGTITNPSDLNYVTKQSFIPKDVMHQLFIDSKNFITSSFFCFNDITYAYNYQSWIENHFAGINKDALHHGDLSEFNVEPSGIIYFILREKQSYFENYIKENFDDMLNFRSWGADTHTAVYEVYLKSVSKSSAIKKILKDYNMSPNDWIAFGDAINDTEMIKDAGFGVAMKNGCDEVKSVAKDFTKFSNDDDGVANYLIELFKIPVL